MRTRSYGDQCIERTFVVDVRGAPADVEDAREAVHGRGEQPVPSRRLEPHARDVLAVRVFKGAETLARAAVPRRKVAPGEKKVLKG